MQDNIGKQSSTISPKFAEAFPCAHDDNDAQTTAKLILNKLFARHGTPARMQSGNTTNFTAAIAQELMKASQVTKVTSTPAHPRSNGLVERQNRTLLTLLRVYTSLRMLDWVEHIDGILGAYNSTRHATTGFSSYIPNMVQKSPFHSRSYTQNSQHESSNLKKNS